MISPSLLPPTKATCIDTDAQLARAAIVLQTSRAVRADAEAAIESERALLVALRRCARMKPFVAWSPSPALRTV